MAMYGANVVASAGREGGVNLLHSSLVLHHNTINNTDDTSWSIVAGGGNGELWLQDIHPSYVASSRPETPPRICIDSEGKRLLSDGITGGA